MTATQTAANAATREMLGRISGLLREGGVPQAFQHSVSLEHLGQVLNAQATTMGFQDGFMMIAVVFVAAMVPAYILSKARDR
jgi:hypothetical protein